MEGDSETGRVEFRIVPRLGVDGFVHQDGSIPGE